jgi:hypothetical protein
LDCRHRLFALVAAGAFTAPVESLASASMPDTKPADRGAEHVTPEALDAIAVVDAFDAASAGGCPERAARLLDPGVVVVVDGRVAGTREDYLALLAGQAPALPRQEERQLLRRQARAGLALAWVVSERAMCPSEPVADGRIETETIVLSRSAEGWKILHLHRSTRAA